MAAYHPLALLERLLAHLHQRKLSSVFMMVGDSETPVTFESVPRLTRVTADRGQVSPRLSIQVHTGNVSIDAKMFTIHFFNSFQAFSVMVTASTVISSFG